MEINKLSPVPLYEQVKQIISGRIMSGEYGPEEKIPSEKQLCLELGVSRPTVRQAVQELMAESLLYIKKGRGTFVRTAREPAVIENFSPFSFSFLQADTIAGDTLLNISQVESLPRTFLTDSKVTAGAASEERPAGRAGNPHRAFAQLSGSTGQEREEGPFWELVRLKSLDRMPYAFIRAYIPVHMFPLLKEQLEAGLDMLAITANKYPFLPHRSDLNFSLSLAENDSSMYLNCSPSEPLFDLTGRLFARSGGRCEYYRALVRSDLIRFAWKKDLR